MSLKDQLKKSSKWGSLFFIYCLFLCVIGKTIVPVDRLYIRGNMPWKKIDPNLSTSRLWNYSDNRSGDAIYQSVYAYKDQLRAKNQDFSFETTLGFPLGVEYGIARGITSPLAFFIKNVLGVNENRSVLYASNIACGIWSWLSFTLLWMIGFVLFGINPYNWVLGIICHPVIIVDGQESWMLGLTGILLIILSMSYTLKNKNFISSIFYKDKEYIIPFLFVAIGTTFMFRSMIFHYYLYVPMLFIFSFPIFYEKKKVSLFIFLGVALTLGLIIESQNLIAMFENLAVSNKSMKTASSIGDRGYSFLPLQQLYNFSIYKPIIQYFKISWGWLDYFFARPYPFIGFNVFMLALIGLKGRSKALLFFSALVILYWTGPLQYLLSITVKGPFATESSGRMGQFSMILFSLLALHSLISEKYIQFKKPLQVGLLLGGGFILLQLILAFVRWKSFWVAGVFELVAALSFFIFLSKPEKRNAIYPALIAIPISVMFFFSGKQTLQANDVSLFDLDEINLSKQLKSSDVAAMVKPVKKNRRELHPTFWNNFNVRSLHAYRNPYHLGYTLLFWSQYDHRQKISKDNELLILRTRLDRLIPLKYNDGRLNYRARRFLNLTGANVVVLPEEYDFFESSWSTIYREKGIHILKRELEIAPIRFVKNTVKVNDTIESINKLYEDPSFDWKNSITVEEDIAISYQDQASVRTTIIQPESVIVKTKGKGVLLTNILYYEGMKVRDIKKAKELKTFECNAAFLCVLVDQEGLSELSFIYE